PRGREARIAGAEKLQVLGGPVRQASVWVESVPPVRRLLGLLTPTPVPARDSGRGQRRAPEPDHHPPPPPYSSAVGGLGRQEDRMSRGVPRWSDMRRQLPDDLHEDVVELVRRATAPARHRERVTATVRAA